MVLWDLIPTCDDAMSCYTLIALSLIITMGIITTSAVVKWTNNEIKEIHERLTNHDNYIKYTTDVINKMQIDLAVQKSSLTDIRADIAEIKKDIKTLLTR